jgi:UDP-N-acetylmuramoyl-L-alanyl-D-glutamate--2,6-diaminopimelate ligase
MIDLSSILNWLDIEAEFLNIEIQRLCIDSRNIEQGDLFIALNGENFHGMDFAYQVQRGGAKAILAEAFKTGKAKPKSRQQPLSIPVIEIDNLSEKLGVIASRFYSDPSYKLNLVGITGTNGKTSSAWLLVQAWEKLGVKGAYIGTIGYGTVDQLNPLKNTTPNCIELNQILSTFINQGITHVALEVSSHGLSQGRVNGLKFSVAAFTNISRDHLDYHNTIEEYAQVKRSLFSNFKPLMSVINANDFYGKKWLLEFQNCISYGISNSDCQLNADSMVLNQDGINFRLEFKGEKYLVHSQLLGQFNIENLCLIISVLSQQFNIKDIIDIIPKLLPVPGRMNKIKKDQFHALIVIDYAHTPDALAQVLSALKQHNADKIWCIFGCGGNRDKGKRPLMGQIAEQNADHVIITDDNPRFESAEHITNEIKSGMKSKPLVIHVRKQAIAYAITHAEENDIILIAGKGHENQQEIQGRFIPCNDRDIANAVLGAAS